LPYNFFSHVVGKEVIWEMESMANEVIWEM